MRLFLISIFLFLATSTAYYGATNLSHLFINVPIALGSLTGACLFFFLLSLAFVVMEATDREGRIRAPGSLVALLCWMLLVPHGGLAIGLLVNYQSSLEIMLAARNSTGANIHFMSDGGAVLDGDIGHSTLISLTKEHGRNEISTLELRSEGGLIDSAISIGAFLKLNGIATFVQKSCESACVIVALSGTELYVTPDAQFGFHRGSAVASPKSELGKYIAKWATDDLIAKLRELGVPEQILKKAEQTPPEEMHYVSGAEFYRAGLAQHVVN